MDAQHGMAPEDGKTTYRDRSFGLVVFGVIEVLMGVFSGLLVPLSLAAWWISRGTGSGMSLAATAPMLVVYAAFSAALITIGIGSVRARRWARDLMLSISRIWLLTGVCTLLLTWAVLPGLLRNLGIAEGLPPKFVLITTVVTLAIISFIYVLLPGAFVLFYRSPDVAATCRARDAGPQFTDNCPQRVLTLAVVWGLAAVSVLAMPAYGWAFPFFGLMLTGGSGAAAWLVVMAICLALAWGSCRLQPWAWRGAVLATLAALVATVLTSIRVSPGEILAEFQIPDDQRAVLLELSWPPTWVICLGWVLVWGSMVAYLITLRGHFDTRRLSADG
jgi:hypothetical protein